MEVKEVQEQKALVLMVITEVGMMIEAREVQT